MADSIKIGSLDISAFKVGSSDCKIYLGHTLLYPTTPPTPPTFQGKWKATYTGGTTSSAECDATSAITQNEITLANLVSVEIGDCVTSIGYQTFRNCSGLTSCTIGSGVTTIGSYVFYNCYSLTSIDIPDSVTSIDSNAFYNCSGLTSIDIPNSVTSIGDYAFRYCNNLTSCTIGSGITSIGANAFRDCSGLTSITCLATTPPTLGTRTFNNTNNCPIYVPASSLSAYQSAWSSYSSRIVAIPSPTPTLQWVTFSNGDTIPSDLDIYGIKGVVNDLWRVFNDYSDNILVEQDRDKYNAIFGGYATPCYNESDIISNTSVEYIFSNIGCSDSYTVSSKTIANMSNDIQLYIYA